MTANGIRVREQVRHSACNSVHCVLVYAWKTRSISWVSRFLKSLTLAPNKYLLFFNKIFGTLLVALVLNHLSTWQSVTIHLPSHVKSLFSLGEQLPDKCQATEGVSPAAASVSLADSSGNFIGSTKMARGVSQSSAAHKPTGGLWGFARMSQKRSRFGPTSRVEDRPKPTLSSLIRTIWANPGFCWEPRISHDPLC